ncbi:hypothetical protein D3X11_01680 [Streptococcus sp. X16XC17]|uniref:hypothetical protein n=1 Tax=unclassified Streptococcus TaxID=2608887 RepID=UPI00066FC9EC|nr:MULTISPECIES: hypothetical protein [unclassified Streptococcus]TCD46193.1 hypothetical protein D3X11_01680 [Streptococcus sp. X16XC17]
MTYDLKNSQTNEQLKNAIPKEATIEGKTGYLIEKTITEFGIKNIVYISYYEEGDSYHLINFQSPKENQAATKKYLEAAIKDWKNLSVESKAAVLDQTIPIPNNHLTASILSIWKYNKDANQDPNSAYYSSIDKQVNFGVFSQSTTGYTVDLAVYAQEYAANVSENPQLTPVTVGQHQAYLIEYIDSSDPTWNTAINVYIVHINEQLITLFFGTLPSEVEPLRPTMEAIISSIK